MADQPVAFAQRSRLLVALVPLKPSGALVQRLDKAARGIGYVLLGMPVRHIALSQLDRIDAGRFRQLVQCIFQHLHADRLARCADRTAAGTVDARYLDTELAVLAAIEKMRRLRDRFVETFPGQVGYQAFMADTGQHAIFAAGQTDMLPRFRPPHRGFEHLRPRQGNADRLAHFLGGQRGGNRFRRNAQLGAKSAADIGRQHADIVRHDMQRIGQFVDIEIEHLVATAQGQLVAVPAGDCTMRLHRRAVVARRAIDPVDGERRVLHRLVEVALVELVVFRQIGVCILCLGIEGPMAHGLVADFQDVRPVARLLESLRDDQRDRLAEIVNLLRPLRRGLIRTALRRPSQQPVVGDHRAHAVLADQLAAGDIGDAALGDGRADQHAVEHVRHLPFVRIGRLAGNLQRAVRTVHRRADQPLHHSVQSVAVVRLVHFLMRGHAAAPSCVASVRTEISTRRVNGILKSLLPWPLASASS